MCAYVLIIKDFQKVVLPVLPFKILSMKKAGYSSKQYQCYQVLPVTVIENGGGGMIKCI